MLRTTLFHNVKYSCIKTIICPIFNNSTQFFSSDTNYDIIIVGGGLIGATLACTLGKNTRLSDKKILLLEAGKKRNWELPEKFSNLVSCLNPGTQKLFDKIGVWKHIEAGRFNTVKGMRISEANSNAKISFDNDNSLENIGYIVENNVTLGAIWQELLHLDNVKVVHEAVINDYKLSDEAENNKLTLKDGSAYTCNLLLGCDGWKSQVRQKMGVHYVSWNYDHMGIVATLELEEGIDNTIAWQKFLPTGTIAMLPLNKKFSSLVWCTSPNHAKELLSLTDQDFIDNLNESWFNSPASNVIVEEGTKALNKIFSMLNIPSQSEGHQLPPKIIRCQEKSRAAFPLGFGHATNYVGKGVALLGDAAHRVHPLAGQGVNLGFGDITCLDSILGDAVYSGSELGSLQYLKEYESQRQRHNVPTMLAVDGLYRLYGTDFPPAVLVRSIGLQALNALNPLKGLIKRHAAY